MATNDTRFCFRTDRMKPLTMISSSTDGRLDPDTSEAADRTTGAGDDIERWTILNEDLMV